MNRALRLALAALGSASLAAAFAIHSAAVAGAQDVPDDRTSRFRDPLAASYWSIIPGGGHLYSGEYEKGVALLGGSIGLLAGGHYASREQCTLFDSIDPSTNMLTVIRACERHRGWFALSIVAASGLWLAGIFDAPDSAHRANFRNGWTSASPLDMHVALRPGVRGSTIVARIPFR